MGEFEELLSKWPAWMEERLPFIHVFIGSFYYLHCLMGLLPSCSAPDYQRGLMWEEQPGLGFYSKSSSGKNKENKISPKDWLPFLCSKRDGFLLIPEVKP